MSADTQTMSRRAALEAGMVRLISDYANVAPDDLCVIAYTPESREYAAYLSVTLNDRGIETRPIGMRPFEDPRLEAELHRILPEPGELGGDLVVFTIEKEALSHFSVFAALFGRYGPHGVKVLRLISASDALFTTGLTMSPSRLAARNATLLSKLRREGSIQVTSEAGTDLDIVFDHEKYEWLSNRGEWRPGGFVILPAGEIATYPATISGKLVADGAVHANVVTTLDVRLRDNPLTVEIAESKAVSVRCDNAEMLDFVEACFRRPNVRCVGELGFGTNVEGGGFTAFNSHLNERLPGVHIGFGEHNQPKSIVPYMAGIHLDIITDDATLYLPHAGETVVLSRFVAEAGIAHPPLIRDEDITGDCCSLNLLGELRPV